MNSIQYCGCEQDSLVSCLEFDSGNMLNVCQKHESYFCKQAQRAGINFKKTGGNFSMSCKGKCKAIRGLKPSSGSRYASGQKRCQECELFILYDGVRCPCCNLVLRSKPRHKQDKECYRRSLEVSCQ